MVQNIEINCEFLIEFNLGNQSLIVEEDKEYKETLRPMYMEYHKKLAMMDYFTVKSSPKMPIKLGLTIYGISSLQPGNIINVDYL